MNLNIFKNIFLILDRKFRLKALYMILFVLFFSIVEIIGVGSIFLFLDIVASRNTDRITDSFSFFKIINKLSYTQIIFYVGIFTVLIITIRNILLVFQEYIKTNFLLSLEAHMRVKLLKNYISQNLDFYGFGNSSNLYSVIYNQLSNLINGTINNVILIIAELIIIISLSIFLIINTSFSSLIIISVTLIGYLLFFIFFKNKVRKIGENRVVHLKEFYSLIQQILKSIKEIKIYNYLDYVLSKTYKNSLKIKSLIIKYKIISIIPKQILEISLVCFLVFFVLINFNLNQQNNELIGKLIFLAAIFYRLTPRVDSFVRAFFSVQYNEKSYKIIKEHLELRTHYNKKYRNLKNSIVLENVLFKYNKENIFKLGPINIKIKKNNIYGITGLNGSGKSTLAELISGLIKPLEGSIIIDKKKMNLEQEKLKISYVPQKSFFFNDSILNNLKLATNKTTDHEIKDKLKKIGALDIFNDLNLDDNFIINETNSNLSGGQLQRLSIIRAILSDSDIIILDESTNAIDQNSETKILKILRKIKKDKIIIIIAHSTKVLKISDKLIKVKKGVIQT